MVDKRLQRQEYLAEVIDKYTNTEPKLSYRDICEVLVDRLGDISELLKTIKKEIRR